MAGCCPPASAVLSSGARDGANDIRDNALMRGESAECFMATATNPTGKHDDATENAPNKIQNTTVPLDAKGAVDMVFKMQDATGQNTDVAGATIVIRTPTSWTMKLSDGGAVWSRSDVVFTSTRSTATFKGQFPDADFGKPFKVLVAAIDAAGEIDSRSFTFSPDKSTGSDSISFLRPLPGAYVSSPFNLQRVHPVTKVVKPHYGADFSIGPGKTTDVIAAADGEVIFTGFEAGGAGNYIKIKHLNSQGKHLCTTVYMHLAKIYVAAGQKVPAGQKIGFEGNTGIGTGPHLHFECRLPNDTRVDPVPYIRGELSVAQQTNADNTPVEGKLQSQTNAAVLTPANVDAKVASCKPYGPAYPTTETAVTPPSAPPSGSDLFTLAWHLTLTNEVGSWWEGTPPTQQSTIQGLIDTSAHIKAVGFVGGMDGDTKFGIAQSFNRSVVVSSMNYEAARAIAYASFWNNKRPGILSTGSNTKRVSIALFDFGYLCGLGGAASIERNAGISASDTEIQAINKLCDAARERLDGIADSRPDKARYKNGWRSRVEKTRNYCTSVALP